MYVQYDTDNSHVSVKDWYWFIYTYKPFYPLYWFCLWPVWPLNLWFHFLINVFIHVNDHTLWTKPILCLWCSWFIFIPYAFISQSFMLFHDSMPVLVCWLFTFLWMNFQAKNLQKNNSIFSFCFEIVLACSFVVYEQFLALIVPQQFLYHLTHEG